ncbi:MAG: hypothetical protein IPI97_04375 [Nitrosomonas sp.]|nr:hypothetical protein [Nitrosomonas sp.]
MTLKHNQHGVSSHSSKVTIGASEFGENKPQTKSIKQNTTTHLSQMEDASWHRSKSARFQQN